MKKITLLSLIIFPISILTGCGSKDFERKQECTKYIPEIEADMKESEEQIPSIDSGYPQFHIKEIFYSPKLETCIVDVENLYSQDDYERVLFDVLTREKKIIYRKESATTEYIQENGTMNTDVNLEDYQNKVDKLK